LRQAQTLGKFACFAPLNVGYVLAKALTKPAHCTQSSFYLFTQMPAIRIAIWSLW
jgi:hypothetical protein